MAVRDEPPFAVAVIDIDLGAEDSMMIAAALQERGVPFVFLTGLNNDDPRVRQYPQAPVVDKPYRIDHLLAALGRALEQNLSASAYARGKWPRPLRRTSEPGAR